MNDRERRNFFGFGIWPALRMSVFVASIGPLLFGLQTVAAEEILDQENTPYWDGGATNILTSNEVAQSFRPDVTNLSRIDVDLLYQGGIGDVTAKLLRNGSPIPGAQARLQIVRSGWTRFNLDSPTAVTPGETLVLRLESDTYPLPLWKYSGDTYPYGTRLFAGRVLDGDFLFRTYSAASLQGKLESPAAGSNQSGLGVISGWVCDADLIELVIDDRPPKIAAYGTARNDTANVCGDINNGFGLLWNYALFGQGEHRIKAYADGVIFANRTFTVGTVGGATFLKGASGTYSLEGFPDPSAQVGIEWNESAQNFTITGAESIGDLKPLDGRYELYRVSLQLSDNTIIDTTMPNFSATGYMVIDGSNITQNITITYNKQTESFIASGRIYDNGYYVTISDPSGASNAILVDRGQRLITSLQVPTLGNEIDYWARTSSQVSSSQSPPDRQSTYPIETSLGGVSAEAFSLFR